MFNQSLAIFIAFLVRFYLQNVYGCQDGKEEAWKESYEALQNVVRSMEDLQHRLLLNLVQQPEALGRWLEALPAQLVGAPAEGDTHRRTVFRNVYFVLLRVLHPWMKQSVVEFPLHLILRHTDSKCPRFGGTLSHLLKESPIPEVTEQQVLRVRTDVQLSEATRVTLAPQPDSSVQEVQQHGLGSPRDAGRGAANQNESQEDTEDDERTRGRGNGDADAEGGGSSASTVTP